MQGIDHILVSYQVIINFGTEVHMIKTKRSANEESESVIAEVIKHLKSNYKELCGQSISLKQTSVQDSLEIIGFGVHNSKRTALFRKKVIFEIG